MKICMPGLGCVGHCCPPHVFQLEAGDMPTCPVPDVPAYPCLPTRYAHMPSCRCRGILNPLPTRHQTLSYETVFFFSTMLQFDRYTWLQIYQHTNTYKANADKPCSSTKETSPGIHCHAQSHFIKARRFFQPETSA